MLVTSLWKLQVRKWKNISKVLAKKCQPEMLYPAKKFQNEDKDRDFKIKLVEIFFNAFNVVPIKI